MTSTAWFFRSSLSAQWWRDSPSSLPDRISPEGLDAFILLNWTDWEYSLHSSSSSDLLSTVNTKFPLVWDWAFFGSVWWEFFLDSGTDFTLFFKRLTVGFFFTDIWCSLIILIIAGVELSSDGVTGILHRFPLISFHFWDLVVSLTWGFFFTFMTERFIHVGSCKNQWPVNNNVQLCSSNNAQSRLLIV